MIKMILSFLVVFGGVFFGIQAFRQLSGKEKWNLTKVASYSALCALFTILILAGIVITF